MSKLLIEEQPLQVLPSLAVVVGLNESVALQQLHWLESNPAMGKVVDGRKWVRMTLDEWRVGHFPFWSEDTIARAFAELREQGLVGVRNDLNQMAIDKTNWYSVDRDALTELENKIDNNPKVIAHRKMLDGHRNLRSSTPQVETTIPDTSNREIPDDKSSGESKPKTKRASKCLDAKPEKTAPPVQVEVFRQMRRFYPPATTWGAIVAAVGADEASLERFRKAIEQADLRGWSPRNVGGVLDIYAGKVVQFQKPTQGSPPVPSANDAKKSAMETVRANVLAWEAEHPGEIHPLHDRVAK